MIRTIREKLSIVMWIVVLAFIATIIFSWGMGGIKKKDPRQFGIIAKINGEDIKYDELRAIEQNLFNQEDKNNLTAVKSAQIRQDAWDQFVRMVAIRQEMAKNEIVVSKEMIYDEIRNNPLPELRQDPNFHTNGTFDIKKWQDLIDNPKPELEQFYAQIQRVYENRLPGKLLEERISNGAYLSDYELLTKFKRENLKAKAKYIKADINSFMPADSLVTDEEIEEYFKNNPHEFPNRKERRNFEYVLFSTDMTSLDSAQTLEEINFINDQLKSGLKFEDVAKNYSEDNSAQSGGDLGYFERGKMVPEFEEAAFNADLNVVVGPVKTKFGYHLIKVTDKKKDKKGNVTEIKASHILTKFKVHQETYDIAGERSLSFREELKNQGDNPLAFKAAAEKLGMEIRESQFTTETDRTSELGMIPGLGNFLFNNKAGDISNLLVSDRGYVYAKIKEIQPETKKTLEEAKKSIIYRAKRKKGLENAYQKLKSLQTVLIDTVAFNKFAEKEADLETGITNDYAVNTYIDALGTVDRVFYDNTIVLEPGDISEPFKGERGAYMIYLIRKDNYDEKFYAEPFKDFCERERRIYKSQILNEWMEGVVEKAEIIDYRNLYGR